MLESGVENNTPAKRSMVCVQGLGFVGSAMAVSVASAMDQSGIRHFDVVGLDLDTHQGRTRVQSINEGLFPFKSGDNAIERATAECTSFGNLRATTDPAVLKTCQVVIIDTNLDVEFSEKEPDVDFRSFASGCRTIGNHINENTLVIVESTVPPGTCNNIVLPILQECFVQRRLNPDCILLAHSYERVMPGPNYLNSIINFWRVYAGWNDNSNDKCKEFFEKIIDTESYPLRQLSSMVASETSKVLENSYRAVNIALIHEWSKFAENVGANLYEVIEAIRDRPTHANIMRPGFGVGGYCLTKDPLFGSVSVRKFFNNIDLEFPFSDLAVATNNLMPKHHFARLISTLEKPSQNISIVMMGIAYRSEVDDTRHSAAEIFYKEALRLDVRVKVHDPHVDFWNEMDLKVDSVLPNLNAVDAVVFCVPHMSYRELNLIKWIGEREIVVFDFDNVLTEQQIDALRKNNTRFVLAGRGDI